MAGLCVLGRVICISYFTISLTVSVLVNLTLLIKPLIIIAIEYDIVKGRDNVPPRSLNVTTTPIIPIVISVSFTTRNDALYLLKIVKNKKHRSKTGEDNIRPIPINAGSAINILPAFSPFTIISNKIHSKGPINIVNTQKAKG